MHQIFEEIELNTNGQGFYNFTTNTLSWLDKQKIKNGILNINILHTSASLVIQENADPDVLYDLKNFFNKLVPMPAHIKSALTNNQLTISLKNKKLILGTWQGLYLFEHRIEKQTRVLSHHLIGE